MSRAGRPDTAEGPDQRRDEAGANPDTDDYPSGVYFRGMNVPLALLGLLEREPSHGYDLKRDYDTLLRAGQAAAVRAGVRHPRPAGPRRQGHRGRGRAGRRARPQALRHHRRRASASSSSWLAEPVAPEPHLQTVLFVKVVLALMSGRSAEEYLDTQRAAAPGPHARAHRAAPQRRASSTRCSPTTACSTSKPTCAGST